MGLIRVGGLWEKEFKNGSGFSGQLDAEELEKILADDPQAAKISILVFDNAAGLEKNDRAPQFQIYIPDGQDDRGSKPSGRRQLRGAGRPSTAPPPSRAHEPEPTNPLDEPTTPATTSPASAPTASKSPSSGRRSAGGNGRRGYGSKRQ